MEKGHSLAVFLNGNLSKRCRVNFHSHTSTRDIIQECIEHLNLPSVGTYQLFDSQGGQIDNDDVEYLNADEPLFLSKGEPFIKSNSLALYQELQTLGKGGFGTVKLYQHILSQKKYAIKFVKLASASELNRIFREIETLRSLTHPNIVKVEDSFTLDKYLCFVMEYCRGGELRKYLELKGRLPLEEVTSLSLQLVDAIRYCHNARVVHRDLKLENLLFADSMHSQLKVVDFGISGMLTAHGQGDSSDAGSLLYLAPEVLSRTDNTSSPALDIWSIGCIIYAMLTGEHPFQAQHQREIMKKILACRYKELPEYVTPPWRVLIRGILRKNPAKRWNLYRISEFLHRWRNETNFSQLPPDSEDEEKANEEKKANLQPVQKPSNRLLAQRRATVAIEQAAQQKDALKVFQRAAKAVVGKKAGATHRPPKPPNQQKSD